MENAIPYCRDLHIDAGTKKLILNLLNSIRSVVPVVYPSEPCKPDGEHGCRSPEEIRSILLHARKRSVELDGIFNPDELLRYTRCIADYQDLIEHIEIIKKELEICRDSALQFADGMAELLEEHLQLTNPDKIGQGLVPADVKLKVV